MFSEDFGVEKLQTGMFSNPRVSVTTQARMKQAKLKPCSTSLPGGDLVDSLPLVPRSKIYAGEANHEFV